MGVCPLLNVKKILKNHISNIIRVSYRLDPEQAKLIDGPDLGPTVCKKE